MSWESVYFVWDLFSTGIRLPSIYIRGSQPMRYPNYTIDKSNLLPLFCPSNLHVVVHRLTTKDSALGLPIDLEQPDDALAPKGSLSSRAIAPTTSLLVCSETSCSSSHKPDWLSFGGLLTNSIVLHYESVISTALRRSWARENCLGRFCQNLSASVRLCPVRSSTCGV